MQDIFQTFGTITRKIFQEGSKSLVMGTHKNHGNNAIAILRNQIVTKVGVFIRKVKAMEGT